MNHTTDYIPPVQETVAHKTDVLRYDHLPEGPCYFEYRPPFTIPLWAYGRMWLRMALVSAVAPAVGWLIGLTVGPALAPGFIGIVSLLSGAAWAIIYALDENKTREAEDIWRLLPGLIVRTCGPPVVWLAIVSTDRLHLLGGAYFYLLAALPVAVAVFDRLATHTVHWTTANLFVTPDELNDGRTAWQERLGAGLVDDHREAEESDEPTNGRPTALLSYVAGLAWVLAAYTIPQTMLALSGRGPSLTLGLELVLASLAGLFMTAFYRIGGNRRIVSHYGRMLAHWFYYSEKVKLPPWLFHSPCGTVFQRRTLIYLAVALLSLHSSCLAAHSLRAIPLGAEDTALSTVETEWIAIALDTSNDWLNRTLWIAPTLLFALCVPLLEFILFGLILIGPVLADYYHQYEQLEGEMS